MYFHEHDSVICPHCGRSLLYGLKREGSGWKALYECQPEDGCGKQFPSRWIPVESVDHFDQAYERATTLAVEVVENP